MFDNKTKYIVVEGEFDMEDIIIFPNHVNHSTMARNVTHPEGVISAGFLTIRDGKVSCFGHSISLDVSSRGVEDSLLAAQVLGLVPLE